MTLRLKTKILISFSTIALVLSCLGAIAVYNRNLLVAGMGQLERSVSVLEGFSDVQLDIDMSLMPPNDYLITGDANNRELFLKLAEHIEGNFSSLENGALANGDLSEARRKFMLVKEKALGIFDLKNPVGNKKGAVLMTEMDALAKEIVTDHLNRYHIKVKDEIVTAIRQEQALRSRVDSLLLAGAVISAALFVLLSMYLIRSIIGPISEFKQSATIIGGGNLDHRVNIKDGLEMNMLADEFNKMADKLQNVYTSLEEKVGERTQELNEINLKLRHMSVTDGLTGVFNHRYLMEKLNEEIKRAARYETNLSLMMMDIDHFKLYNDTNGHPAGDRVLRDFASSIIKNARETDTVGRYGGEEFCVLLPETGKEEARLMAERIRVTIEKQDFPNGAAQPGGRLTMSIGVASYPEDASEPNQLLSAADQALYRAKNIGRNRVETALSLNY